MTTRDSGTRQQSQGVGVAQANGGENLLTLEIPATIIVSDLAELMDVTPVEVIKEFMRNGFMYSINEVVEHDSAALIAAAFGYEVLPLEPEAGPAERLPAAPPR